MSRSNPQTSFFPKRAERGARIPEPACGNRWRIAGVAAATALCERGVDVTLLEREAQLGGRASGFSTTIATGERVEMERGFHAFFRQYYNLRALLRRIHIQSWPCCRSSTTIPSWDQEAWLSTSRACQSAPPGSSSPSPAKRRISASPTSRRPTCAPRSRCSASIPSEPTLVSTRRLQPPTSTRSSSFWGAPHAVRCVLPLLLQSGVGDVGRRASHDVSLLYDWQSRGLISMWPAGRWALRWEPFVRGCRATASSVLNGDARNAGAANRDQCD